MTFSKAATATALANTSISAPWPSSFSGAALSETLARNALISSSSSRASLSKAATATPLASTGFSGATLSKTFTKTLISSSSSRAHLVEGGLEGLAAQLARELARTGC